MHKGLSMRYIYNLIILAIIMTALSFSASAQLVRMETVLGNIDIELHPDAAPNTVTNFLNYMNSGDYNNSFIHRNGISEGQVFIVQGGGFRFVGGSSFQITANPPVDNEFLLPNNRGTIAMAKIAGDPDSATSQWFFNVVDNPFLNSQNGGFTVFGTVTDGMEVVDAIAALQAGVVPVSVNGTVFNFAELPYLNDLPTLLQEEDAVIISNVFEIDPQLNINPGLNGAWFNPNTPGQGITLEILPVTNRAFAAWFAFDTMLPAADATANVGDAGHRWLSGQGVIDAENTTITFDLFLTSGGLFDNNQQVTNSEPGAYGTLVIDFEDCSNAMATYTLIAQELSGSFPLTRISAENVSLCQRLSSDAN